MTSMRANITFDPPARTWHTLFSSPALDADQIIGFRRELRLPLATPLVLSGHQPEFWHAGILAKHLAASAIARASSGAAAWLSVDHDETSPLEISYPARENARLARRSISLQPDTEATIPACFRELVDPDLITDVADAALPSVADGLASARDALAANRDAPSAAAQISGALEQLIAPFAPVLPTINSTDISRTALWREIIQRIAGEPRLAARTFNDALDAVPSTHVAPLAIGDDPELPLWRMTPGEPRARVFASGLADIDPADLAPRALLMTGIIRLAGCDLFIHGTGGAAYDRATELWFGRWLGLPLAPAVLATADLALPLHDSPAHETDLHRAIWKRHHAAHDPAMLDDHEAAARKRDLLSKISEAKRSGADPMPHFQQMQQLLDRYRADHADDLVELDKEIERTRRRLEERSIATDRTWPFFLHTAETLAQMRTDIEAHFHAPSPDVTPSLCSARAH